MRSQPGSAVSPGKSVGNFAASLERPVAMCYRLATQLLLNDCATGWTFGPTVEGLLG